MDGFSLPENLLEFPTAQIGYLRLPPLSDIFFCAHLPSTWIVLLSPWYLSHRDTLVFPGPWPISGSHSLTWNLIGDLQTNHYGPVLSKRNVSHMCNFKFSSSHIKKKLGEVNYNMFHLTIENIISTIHIKHEVWVFWYWYVKSGVYFTLTVHLYWE